MKFRPRVYRFTLNGKRPEACASLMRWAQWLESADTRVAQTHVGEIFVSTVFLGLDHNFFGEGAPVLFETMIFNHGNNEYQRRYSTWEEAEAGHARAVELVNTHLAELKGLAEQEAGEVIRRVMERASKP